MTLLQKLVDANIHIVELEQELVLLKKMLKDARKEWILARPKFGYCGRFTVAMDKLAASTRRRRRPEPRLGQEPPAGGSPQAK